MLCGDIPWKRWAGVWAENSLVPIPVIAFIARGTQGLNCSVHGSMGRALNNSAVACRVPWNQLPAITGIGKRLVTGAGRAHALSARSTLARCPVPLASREHSENTCAVPWINLRRFLCAELCRQAGAEDKRRGRTCVPALNGLEALATACQWARCSAAVLRVVLSGISASFSSSHGQQAALKCSERSDSVTRE